MDKINIELTSYDAITILVLLSTCNYSDKKMSAVKEVVDRYEQQLGEKITKEQLQEMVIQSTINQLLNREP